jgi:hypothetical protein
MRAQRFPSKQRDLSKDVSAPPVGAPRTTRTEFKHHLNAYQEEQSALGLSYRDRSASRLTAEFSGRTPAVQHAGAPATRRA